MAAYQFTKAILHPHTNCLVIAQDNDASANLYQMSTFFYDNLDPMIRPMRRYYNTSRLVFDNPDEKDRHKNPGLNSRIVVQTANKAGSAGRSFAFQSVHMSEFAFWKDPGETFDAIMGAVPDEPETLAVVESTPNGAGGAFYDLWREASVLRGNGPWIPIFIPFWLEPQYKIRLTNRQKWDLMDTLDVDEERYIKRFKLTPEQLAWRRVIIQSNYRGSVEKFNQEMAPSAEECFLVKGDSVFNKEALQYYMRNCKKGEKGFLRKGNGDRVEFVPNGVGPVTIFHPPNPTAQYGIGADPAWGVAKGDFSAMCVLRAGKKPVQVAEFHARLEPPEFAEQAILLGKYYNQAMLMPESTGTGSALIFALKDKYPRLGMWERLNTRGKGHSKNLGWDQNKKSQQIMRGEMTSAVYERSVEINSEHLIREMSTYVYKDDLDSMEAAPGAHDDLVIAFGLALMALNQMPDDKLGVSFAPDDGPIVSNSLWTPYGLTGISSEVSEDWMMM